MSVHDCWKCVVFINPTCLCSKHPHLWISHLFQTLCSLRPVKSITSSCLWTTWPATSSPSHPQAVFCQVLIMSRRFTLLSSRPQTPAGEQNTLYCILKPINDYFNQVTTFRCVLLVLRVLTGVFHIMRHDTHFERVLL